MKPNSGGVYIQDATGALTPTDPDPREQQRIARAAKAAAAAAAASEAAQEPAPAPRRPAGEVQRPTARPRTGKK